MGVAFRAAAYEPVVIVLASLDGDGVSVAVFSRLIVSAEHSDHNHHL